MNGGSRTATLYRHARRARRALICVLPVLLLALATTAAADPITGTYVGGGIGRGVRFSRSGHDRSAWAGTLRFQLDSGEELLAFCIQLEVGVRSGDRYKSDGPVVDLENGCQLANVLDGYPASTASSPDEAAARQLALWHFSDDVDLATIPDDDAALRDRAESIATDAAEGACPARRTTAPDLRLEPAVATATAGERIVYTVSAGPEDGGETIQATLTGPAVFDNGRQDASVDLGIDGNASLGVTSDSAGDTVVKVEMPYRLEGGTVFSQIDTSQPTQRLVLAEDRDLVAEASATGTWSEQPTETPVPDTETPIPASATPVATRVPTMTPTTVVPTVGPSAVPSQVSPTAVVTTVGKTPRAEVTPAPTPTPMMPTQLPRTGGRGPSPWPALALGALLLVAGWAAWRGGDRVRGRAGTGAR